MHGNNEAWVALIPWVALAGSVLCLLFALKKGSAGRLVDDTPTSKTTGVFIGLVELKGTAEAEAPLTSFLAVAPCVYYAWTVQENWSRIVTETYTDSQGHSQTRTRVESGWVTVASDTQLMPFYLQDDCGTVLVQPTKAKVEPATVFSETCTPLNSLYYGKGPAGAIPDSTFRRQFSEVVVPLHAPLFLMGHARERQDVVAPEVAYDEHTSLFIISTRSEAQVSSGYKWIFRGLGFLGLVLVVVAGFFLSPLAPNLPPFVLPVVAGVLYFGASVLGWVWMAYNSLVNLRERTRQAWANVDVQLKRRHDLIPNLVSIVEGLRDYEKNVQTEVARLRSEANATAPGVAGPDHGACTQVVAAIVERYPELKANDSFKNLMKQLSDTEQRIALARGYFNDIATFLNTRLEKIPDKFIAMLGAMKPQVLMAANDFERAPVVVKLAG